MTVIILHQLLVTLVWVEDSWSYIIKCLFVFGTSAGGTVLNTLHISSYLCILNTRYYTGNPWYFLRNVRLHNRILVY